MSDSIKEKIFEVYPNPISIEGTNKILEQMKKCICKICNEKGVGTGFFCRSLKKNITLMITNNHIIDEEILKKYSKIEVSLNDGEETIEIDLNNKKLYTNIIYDTTIIEINEEKIEHYIDLDESILEENINIYNKNIYILQYSRYNSNEMKAAVSYGIIKELIEDYNLNHICNTYYGSSGSPILDISNNKVIGIHKSCSKNENYNIGTYLKYPIKEYLNNKNIIKKENNILITLKIDNKDINKKIYFLNNSNDNLKELNESNTELFINDTQIKYENFFKPEKEGNYVIKLKFNTKIKDCSFMFSKCQKIVKLDLSSFDTSSVTDMNNLFSYCNNIVSLDLSSFDTKNVTNMKYMFYHCHNLEYLNLFSFDTHNVTDMSYMFYNCNKLIDLNLSYFNTYKVTNMSQMFSHCEKLTNLNLSSSFNTEIVSDMSYMFHYCENIKELNLINFYTPNVTNMEYMFYNCKNIINLEFSIFNSKIVTDMSFMFFNCINLASLKLSFFNTNEVEDMSYMFYGCRTLRNLDLSSFNTKKVKYMNNMFCGCKSLINLNLSSFDTQNVIYMQQMFYDCNNLINLDLSYFNTIDTRNITDIFKNCNNLEKVKLDVELNKKIIEVLNKFNKNVIINENKMNK